MYLNLKTYYSLFIFGLMTLVLTSCPSENHSNPLAALGERNLSDMTDTRALAAAGANSNGPVQSNDESRANHFFRNASERGLSRAVNGLVEPQQHNCNDDVAGENCVNYDEEQFDEDGGKKLGDAVREGMTAGTAAKKESFFEHMAPLAIKIQTRTGMPASLLLAQWAQETGWGVGASNSRNDIQEDHNIIAGHSCWSKSTASEEMAISEDLNLGVSEINIKCDVDRPQNEGAYYHSFERFEDAAYAHVQNLLKNPGTAENYQEIRQLHSNALENSRVADSLQMADGLGDYAADPNYITSVKRLINDNNLQKYDSFSICGEMPNINVRYEGSGPTLTGDGAGMSIQADASGNPVAAGSVKSEPQVNWNECDGSGGITAGYQGGRCASRRKVSEPFLEFFNDTFKPCVGEGLKAKGINKEVASVYINHNGVTGDSSHSNRSYHSINRAIDVSSITITYTDGSKQTVDSSNQNSSEASFFSAFRSCWSSSVISSGRPSSCPGSIPKGSIGHEDDDHKHHLHLSLPFCPQKSGYYIK